MDSWTRKAAEEPYRMFFPAGVLAGLYGVMMWPMVYRGMLSFYPAEAHARLMVCGFLGAFVAGFLGTAFPRLSGTRSWGRLGLAAMLLLWLAMVLLHASDRVRAGDAFVAGFLLLLLGGMLWRIVSSGRKDTPPPGFVLALAGVLGGLGAAAYLAWQPTPEPAARAWARLLLFQGFTLLPVMGIAPYLLPRFFGKASTHSFDDSPVPPAGWWPKALAAAAAGGMILLSFALEVAGHPGGGHALRAAVIALWLLRETPGLARPASRSTPGNAARWAVLGLFAGIAATALWPAARVGTLHLFFAAGIGLMAIAAGTRVILGHAGRHDLLGGKILWLRWVAGILILAAATRVTSDFVPAVRVSHHIYAAWCWAAGCLLWLGFVGRHLIPNNARPTRPPG